MAISYETREDFMQSIYDMFSDDGNNDRANQIIDIFDIATENCIELPCKAGDIIYEICERRKSGEWKKIVVERVVHGIDVGIGGSMVARCGTTISVFLSGIGKTVFLTRGEALKALKEQDSNVNK